ncbi:CBO0543 family protein [Ammoniphilus resinae]|uniref:Uncharacterized protein n=1 Tax=Ammoniphilus resinae TaxID=861532 RepID=A0ABS4GXS1_9BACL|nr:CBO0543 family protein [Ammoniphilus resinae]MBP1935075.1 hypothetical protein [Ammoniphilus resinae]
MVSIILFILSWLAFLVLGDKRRVPELFPTAMFSAYLGLLTDLVMKEYELWSYHDQPLSESVIPLFLDFGIYPVVAYLFIQFLPQTWTKRLGWIFFWSLGAILLEYAYLKFELMQHHRWWSLWISYISDWVIYVLLILQYQFYKKGRG